MKKNVIIIVLDALSKWYIDQIKAEDEFFSYLEKNSYCCTNMYASGPFTEAAIRGMWESGDAVTGSGLLGGIEHFRAKPFFELFQENDYKDIYLQYPMLLTTDALRRRGIHGVGWVGDTVSDRLRYYSDLKQKGELRLRDYKIIRIWLEHWFDIYRNKKNASFEYEKYIQGKNKYINDLLEDELKQRYFQDDEGELANDYILRAERVEKETILDTERILESLIFHKNAQFMMEPNYYDRDTINAMLGFELYNKELATGANILYSMRSPFCNIRDDFEDFWSWYNNRPEMKQPFLAYIHNSSFHLPERFMNAKYGEEGYEEEIQRKIKEVEALQFKKMSVAKQLSLSNISGNLSLFWNELEKKDLFKNTYLIITADHGSANTIYFRPESKWNYAQRIFQVPFYMAGADIVPCMDCGFHMAQDMLPTLIEKCELDAHGCQYMGQPLRMGGAEYAFSTWVHGAFDLYRQEIKMGIRNSRYSINCIGYITQFFGSCRFTACDLGADPDEADDVYAEVREREDFKELYQKLRDKWFEIAFDVLTDKKNPWDFSERYGFLVDKKKVYREYNNNQREYSEEKFKTQLREKQVIITGTDDELEMFLKAFGMNYQIREIWDIAPEKQGSYVFGHKIHAPRTVIDQDNTLFIVTSRLELEVKECLDNMGIKEYVFWRLIK